MSSIRHPSEFVNHPSPFPGGTFRAVCRHVVDGDTIDVLADVGFNLYVYATVRVLGVNTPELRGGTDETRAAAQQAKDFVRLSIEGQPVLIQTLPDKETFGRYLARVSFWDADGALHDLSTELISAGLGVPMGNDA